MHMSSTMSCWMRADTFQDYTLCKACSRWVSNSRGGKDRDSETETQWERLLVKQKELSTETLWEL